jgi:hypothetical protein
MSYAPPGSYPPMSYALPMHGRPVWSPRIRKPTGWFIVNWLFFWPTAIYSLVAHWNNIDPAAYAGDIGRAQFHTAKVRKLGIIALCIFGGIVVLYLIMAVVIITSLPPIQ